VTLYWHVSDTFDSTFWQFLRFFWRFSFSDFLPFRKSAVCLGYVGIYTGKFPPERIGESTRRKAQSKCSRGEGVSSFCRSLRLNKTPNPSPAGPTTSSHHTFLTLYALFLTIFWHFLTLLTRFFETFGAFWRFFLHFLTFLTLLLLLFDIFALFRAVWRPFRAFAQFFDTFPTLFWLVLTRFLKFRAISLPFASLPRSTSKNWLLSIAEQSKNVFFWHLRNLKSVN